MTDEAGSGAPPDHLLKIVDPLGEIHNRAKELWTEEGRPEGKTWRDYWSRAERELCGGISDGKPNERWRERAQPEDKRGLLIESDNPVVQRIAPLLPGFLNEHESYCLAHMLMEADLKFSPTDRISQQSLSEAAEIAAELTGTYGENFQAAFKVREAEKTTLVERVNYWSEVLEKAAAQDEPLSYNDRNTIERLRSLLGLV